MNRAPCVLLFKGVTNRCTIADVLNPIKRRTRLSPEARKIQLLNVAKNMILERGLQEFSMEALARNAAVSSPLVYNYFPSRLETLRALLTQEYEAYTRDYTEQVDRADGFEQIVRIFIVSNFDYYAPGNIIPILDSQPEIADAIREDSVAQVQKVASYFVRTTAESYKLTKTQAELVVAMSSGASIAAAKYASFGRSNQKKAVDHALTFVVAGMERIARQDAQV